jgi:HPt (histidine-containing phosphotransfer) domain-containing protein
MAKLSTNSTFDWNQLHQLAGGDSAFETELLQMFLEDADRSLGQLAEAIAAGRVETVEEIAHYLKGASANVGACALSERAAQLELQARARQLSQPERLLAEMQNLCREVRLLVLTQG